MKKMPIDPDFKEKRERLEDVDGLAVWGSLEPPEKLGIRGTTVCVDWDICQGEGVCLSVCPVQLYEWRDTPGNPVSDRKTFPERESDCIQCLACENGCPVQAIKIMI